MNLSKILEKATSKNPNKPYLFFEEKEISYNTFNKNVNKVANGFSELGVRKGDRVCIMVSNCPEFLYTWFGLSKIGGIIVPINVAFKEKETEYIVSHSESMAIVAEDNYIPIIEAVRAKTPKLSQLIHLGEEEYPAWTSFQALQQLPDELKKKVELTGEDISTIMYTSGTTGPPKGVMIPHKSYIYCGEGFTKWLDIRENDRLFTCLPLHHANAQYYSTMGSLVAGASLILVDRFSASRFWDKIRNHGATIFNFIGAMLLILIKQPESEKDKDNLVRVAYGNPALKKPIQDYIEKRYGIKIICGYALTECPFGTIQPLYGIKKEGSMGLPRQHPSFKNEVKIFDDDDNELPPGSVGELVLRNPAIMEGYFKELEITKKTLRGGWLHTGDNAYQDKDGYFYFVDRKKDIIRRRGENISSIEVENVINAHPKVLESAVIGIPSEFSEEEIKAYIVLKSGEIINPADMFNWCKERLAHFKIPRYIELMDFLPKTSTHRVEKYKLRSERRDFNERCFDREQLGVQIR